MTWLLGSRHERHEIDEGLVLCPRYGSVDVERCLRCAQILEVVRAGDPHIRCTGVDLARSTDDALGKVV